MTQLAQLVCKSRTLSITGEIFNSVEQFDLGLIFSLHFFHASINDKTALPYRMNSGFAGHPPRLAPT